MLVDRPGTLDRLGGETARGPTGERPCGELPGRGGSCVGIATARPSREQAARVPVACVSDRETGAQRPRGFTPAPVQTLVEHAVPLSTLDGRRQPDRRPGLTVRTERRVPAG